MSPTRTWFRVFTGILQHRRRLGPAIWELMWLIDKTTKERAENDGADDEQVWGVVLGGIPIAAKRIAQDLQESVDTARQHLTCLADLGYVRRIPSEAGDAFRYEVAKSKKWSAERRTLQATEAEKEREASLNEAPSQKNSHKAAARTIPEEGDKYRRGQRKNRYSIKEEKQLQNTGQELQEHSSAEEGAITSLHAFTRSLIQKEYQEAYGITVQWDVSEQKLLSGLIARNPSWTKDDITRMVRNRFQSEGIPPERPRRWLPRIADYAAGPLDRFNKLKKGDVNGKYTSARHPISNRSAAEQAISELIGIRPDAGGDHQHGSPVGGSNGEADDGRTIEGICTDISRRES